MDDRYEVSTLGRVRAKARKVHCKYGYRNKRQHILTPHINHNGYYHVTWIYKGKRKNWFVHRLVAYAFIGFPDNDKLQINHINGNKLDNAVTNLEWVSSSYNTIHSYRTGLQDPKVLSLKQWKRRITPEQVHFIKEAFKHVDTTVKGNKMMFYREMQEKYGFSQPSAVIRIIKGTTNRFFN